MNTLQACEKLARDTFISAYRLLCFQVDLNRVLADFRARFNRPPSDDWQEHRKALIWAACIDLKHVEATVSGGKARDLVAAKYNGLSLGVVVNKKPAVLALSSTTLWRQYRRGVHLAGGSPDSLTVHSGKHERAGAHQSKSFPAQ